MEEQLEDKMEEQLDKMEEQLEDKMGRQLKEKEKRLDKEKPLEDARKQRLEEEQKLVMVKEEMKKRNQDKTEKQLEDELLKWVKEKKKREPLINSRSMTPPPRCSRSSRTRSSSRECQPGDAQPDPVLQGVVNCLMSISKQMLRMSEGSDKNGGWPWFNGTYKDYPAFGGSGIATKNIITS